MWIYNSAHRRKEEFKPLHEGKVGIYACGPTVYNYFHIGNARPFITFDVLRRQLEREGYDVTFVQNFTDIDDKMIKRANEEGITVRELGEKFIAEYYKDAKALGIRPATVHPKATEHIPEIIALVQKLIDGGHAYATPAGDVYYRVESFPGYGKLSGQSVEDREMGASEPGRGNRQGEPRRLCAVEGAEARRARLGIPLGHGPARLAHRVLRHVHEVPGRNLRHPLRRQGSALPPP